VSRVRSEKAGRLLPGDRTRLARVVLIFALVLVCPALLGIGETPEWRNRRGNRLYRESKYDEALTEYRSAQVLAPELRELAFNAGDALFRKGDMPGAVREFEKATGATDSLMASGAFYNAGNAYLSMGQLEPAIESYKQALRSDPEDEDAKHNLELALQMLEQQQQDQQDQEDQQDQQDEQDQQDQQDQQEQQDEQDQQDQQDQQDEQDQEDQQDQQGGQDEQDQQEQQEQHDQPNQEEQGMSAEDAARLLDAVEQAERELQAELRAAKAKKRTRVEKDW